jgi:hypothetical protein
MMTLTLKPMVVVKYTIEISVYLYYGQSTCLVQMPLHNAPSLTIRRALRRVQTHYKQHIYLDKRTNHT